MASGQSVPALSEKLEGRRRICIGVTLQPGLLLGQISKDAKHAIVGSISRIL